RNLSSVANSILVIDNPGHGQAIRCSMGIIENPGSPYSGVICTMNVKYAGKRHPVGRFGRNIGHTGSLQTIGTTANQIDHSRQLYSRHIAAIAVEYSPQFNESVLHRMSADNIQ